MMFVRDELSNLRCAHCDHRMGEHNTHERACYADSVTTEQRLNFRIRACKCPGFAEKKDNHMSLTKKILDHLTVDGHPQRKQCLADLVDRNVFAGVSDERQKEIVVNYLIVNPRGFCASGIQRFKDALGLVPKKTVRVVLDVEVDVDWSLWGDINEANGRTRDGNFSHALAENIVSKVKKIGLIEITKAVAVDWDTTKATMKSEKIL